MLKKYICFLLSLFFLTAHAQEKIDYRLDAFGSASTGIYTPFWIVSNTYGTVPLQPNSGYLRGDLAWSHSFRKDLKLEAEVDVVTASKHTSSLWVQQLYAAVSYKDLVCLSLGAKENYRSMLDKNLSMGDMTYSPNARPIPEVNLAFPHYTTLPFTKGKLQFKADFAVGKSMDNDYILRTKNPNALYTINLLWHHKSLFLKWEDPHDKFPFFGIFGLEHAAQWGGWTSYADFGQYPVSFKDFIRIVLCKNGGENAILGDQKNVLGNHLGTYNIKVAYKGKNFQLALYKQHFFEDNSGLEMANWRDGIWGGELSFSNQPFLRKMVFEYLQSTNQSGPMHFLWYDWVLYPNARGGGNDDYYNHEFYTGGWTYFGRALANPLFTSQEYNKDREFRFKDNRLKSVHLGMEGNITGELSYRTLFTGVYGWGTMYEPFTERKSNFSTFVECAYKPGKRKDWQIGLQFAFDKGNMYGDNWGCSLKVSKFGSIGF